MDTNNLDGALCIDGADEYLQLLPYLKYVLASNRLGGKYGY